MTTIAERIRVQNVQILSDDWYVLKKTTFDYQRADGTWQRVSRETYDRGNGAAILLYNREKQTVILTRQFRYPAYVNDHSGILIEVCAGLMDERDPLTAITREAAEETGYQVRNAVEAFEAFMSPGSVTEKLHFFVAKYQPDDRLTDGGGLIEDGEEIQVLEIPFTEALQMIDSGEIADAKTIMLLQYAALKGLLQS